MEYIKLKKLNTIIENKIDIGNTKLLTTSGHKMDVTNRNDKGYHTAITYLAPYDLSGHIVCSNASPECILACLNTSGHGIFDSTQNARIKRTKYFYQDKKVFYNQLSKELNAHVRSSEKLGLIPNYRFNGTSDLIIEKIYPQLFNEFPQIIFHDYTKIDYRIRPVEKLPSNYDLTFSRSEINHDKAFQNIYNRRVSVVFSTKKDENLPKEFFGYKVIDGDLDDKQFLLDHNIVIGLRLKGIKQIKKFNHLSYLDSIGLRKYDNVKSFVWKV